jgi:hypothetical protein
MSASQILRQQGQDHDNGNNNQGSSNSGSNIIINDYGSAIGSLG